MNTQHTEECAESIPWYSRSLDFEQLQRDYPPPPDYFRTTYRMPRDALRAARLEVGNAPTVRDEVRSHGWENAVSSLLGDLRYTARMLRKSPVFTVVVIAVISLGTGAVTTVFSAMNAGAGSNTRAPATSK